MVPINYLAILLCGIVSMVLGFVWYGPLFGKKWMHLMGISHDEMERAKSDPAMKAHMYRSYALMFVGSIVMAFVLAHALIFASKYLGVSGLTAGLQAGFWNWIGFIAPVTLGSVLWEKKPWMLWVLNNAYYLVLLLAMGIILATWQ